MPFTDWEWENGNGRAKATIRIEEWNQKRITHTHNEYVTFIPVISVMAYSYAFVCLQRERLREWEFAFSAKTFMFTENYVDICILNTGKYVCFTHMTIWKWREWEKKGMKWKLRILIASHDLFGFFYFAFYLFFFYSYVTWIIIGIAFVMCSIVDLPSASTHQPHKYTHTHTRKCGRQWMWKVNV